VGSMGAGSSGAGSMGAGTTGAGPTSGSVSLESASTAGAADRAPSKAGDADRLKFTGPHDGAVTADDRKLRVLLVEDDADTREITASLLGQIHYAVTEAATLTEALAACRRQSFDILISDLHLPDGTGLHLMRRLKLRKGGLSGIVLSGAASPSDIGRAKGAGFSAYLKKPVTFAELRTALAQLR
jgi:CheY-like chemotaxis protein